MAQTRATCETDETTKAECTSVLSSMGFEYDAYWKSAVSVYQDQQTIFKATSALRDEYVSKNDTAAEGEDLEWLAVHNARENANIVWNDEGVKALFDQALAERASYLEQLD